MRETRSGHADQVSVQMAAPPVQVGQPVQAPMPVAQPIQVAQPMPTAQPMPVAMPMQAQPMVQQGVVQGTVITGAVVAMPMAGCAGENERRDEAERVRQQQLASAEAEMEAVRARVAALGGAPARGGAPNAPPAAPAAQGAECPICMERPKDCALSCGHMICMQCSNRVQHCPICRQQIQDRRQLFL